MALGLLSGIALAVITLIAAILIITPVFGARTAFFERLMAPLCLISGGTTVPVVTMSRQMAFQALGGDRNSQHRSSASSSVSDWRWTAWVARRRCSARWGAVTTLGIAWVSAPPPLPRLHRAPPGSC